MIRSTLDFRVPDALTRNRTAFDYISANWRLIRRDLLYADWAFLDYCGVDTATLYFTNAILSVLERYMPKKIITESFGRHPWINDRCLKLVKDKLDAFGTSSFRLKADLCSRGLRQEYEEYIKRTRNRLRKLPRGSKLWWKLARTIMDKSTASSSIPTKIYW